MSAERGRVKFRSVSTLAAPCRHTFVKKETTLTVTESRQLHVWNRVHRVATYPLPAGDSVACGTLFGDVLVLVFASGKLLWFSLKDLIPRQTAAAASATTPLPAPRGAVNLPTPPPRPPGGGDTQQWASLDRAIPSNIQTCAHRRLCDLTHMHPPLLLPTHHSGGLSVSAMPSLRSVAIAALPLFAAAKFSMPWLCLERCGANTTQIKSDIRQVLENAGTAFTAVSFEVRKEQWACCSAPRLHA